MSRLSIRNINYIYNEGLPFAKQALKDVSLEIEAGEFVGLIGHTGSGKSTLIQHLNGLIQPTSGEILVDGVNYHKEQKKLSILRQKVGLVFQYPEYQLFEETVIKDIAYGPSNLGLSEEEIQYRVREAMEQVGLDIEKVGEKSPFELSGGQKRRVAIAGILAMKPEILVLDEPTAGLDPHGSKEILEEIKSIFEGGDTTIILVSHSMEEIARLATRMVVMDHGQIVMDGKPRDIFKEEEKLIEIGLGVPQVRSAMGRLKDLGLNVNEDCITVEEAVEELYRYWEGNKNV
ncbi:energy-coupling factor transporter ATPase [Peptoniphilus sp. KCTC 25270]|uniref:energy-coupling factor transporter ATPase n=1 Tax=Peptoniphilus sp. KCTC 25270 TaxID=2897414 RepID=UPI001E3657C0|nr:energy-coupling factor transporter ATPase [Peptoniphilus sp. KCTC 25270]MCD1146739.1 energy-coupling factor transporter ATPase [Peptoniphilus sp. KCTC 25270]